MKLNKLKSILIVLTSAALLSSCNINDFTVYDTPFVWFDAGSSSSTSISSQGNSTGQYVVKYSGARVGSTLEVNYEVTVGDGLEEGIDFTIQSDDRTVSFLSGVYERNIRISWHSHNIDPDKDNTVILTLVSANQDVTFGFPGPDQNNKSIVIRKY